MKRKGQRPQRERERVKEKTWAKPADCNTLPPSSALPPLLPHQTHELNTADTNASKLEKVGIQLNHVANSANMTASFRVASLVTAGLNPTSSSGEKCPVREPVG